MSEVVNGGEEQQPQNTTNSVTTEASGSNVTGQQPLAENSINAPTGDGDTDEMQSLQNAILSNRIGSEYSQKNSPAQGAEGRDSDLKSEYVNKAPVAKTISVGRVVSFFGGLQDTFVRNENEEANPEDFSPALVVKVLDDNQVNLQVFSNNADGSALYRNVPHKDVANGEYPYWEWPVIK
jgi:hypothetical protein